MALADVEGGSKAKKKPVELPARPTMVDMGALDQQYSTVVRDGMYEDQVPRWDPKMGKVRPMASDDFYDPPAKHSWPTVPRMSFVLDGKKPALSASTIARIIGAKAPQGPGLAATTPRDYRSPNVEDRRFAPSVITREGHRIDPAPPIPAPGSKLADVMRRARE